MGNVASWNLKKQLRTKKKKEKMRHDEEIWQNGWIYPHFTALSGDNSCKWIQCQLFINLEVIDTLL